MQVSGSELSLQTIRRGWMAGGPAVALVLIGAWWWLLGGPIIAAREEVNRELEEVSSLRTGEHAIRQRLVQVAAEAEQTRRAEEARRRRILEKHDDASFLHWVNQQAHECGLVVRDFRPAGRVVLGEYERSGVLIESQGTYEVICQFLDRLRACSRMNRVSSFEITPRDAERTTFALSMQIVLFAQAPLRTSNPPH